MSLMGFQKKNIWIGGWVGGLSSIQFCLDFWNFFNFAKPLTCCLSGFNLSSSLLRLPLAPSTTTDCELSLADISRGDLCRWTSKSNAAADLVLNGLSGADSGPRRTPESRPCDPLDSDPLWLFRKAFVSSPG